MLLSKDENTYFTAEVALTIVLHMSLSWSIFVTTVHVEVTRHVWPAG